MWGSGAGAVQKGLTVLLLKIHVIKGVELLSDVIEHSESIAGDRAEGMLLFGKMFY